MFMYVLLHRIPTSIRSQYLLLTIIIARQRYLLNELERINILPKWANGWMQVIIGRNPQCTVFTWTKLKKQTKSPSHPFTINETNFYNVSFPQCPEWFITFSFPCSVPVVNEDVEQHKFLYEYAGSKWSPNVTACFPRQKLSPSNIINHSHVVVTASTHAVSCVF